jgi:hypothetical protein
MVRKTPPLSGGDGDQDMSYIVSSAAAADNDDSGSDGEERRFVWKLSTQAMRYDGPAADSLAHGDTATSSSNSIKGKAGYSKYGKHQKNFSATKYIKP